jgi:opacity protein-like surface antigen
MKKLLLIVAFATLTLTSVNAQQIGVLAGLTSVQYTGDFGDDSETGFHIGVYTEFDLSDAIILQPELTYATVDEFDALSVNGIFKYGVSDNFNVQAGPQIGYALGDNFDSDDFTKLNLQLAVGAGYAISDNLITQIRYGLQLNNHYTGDGDGDVKLNSFSVSLGYKF